MNQYSVSRNKSTKVVASLNSKSFFWIIKFKLLRKYWCQIRSILSAQKPMTLALLVSWFSLGILRANYLASLGGSADVLAILDTSI